MNNRSIRDLGSWQVLTAPPEAVTTVGRPVVNLSLAINYALGGLAVQGYHLGNLVLHILATLALFGLVRRTLLLPALAPRFATASTGLALTVALLWALHPLQTESVTYVVQRAESIVGLFYLLTLTCLVRGAHSGRGQLWHALAVLACGLGMASKEVMVSAPVMALLYHRIFLAGSWKESLRRRWGLWLSLAATWVLLAIVHHLSQNRGGSAGFSLGVTPWQYLRTQFGCIIHYLRLVFWPSPLVLDYGYPIAERAAEIVPYAIAVLVLLGVTAVALVRRPQVGFLGVCFFAILAPTSSIVPLVGQTEAEHRMYLPLAAVVTLVVLAAHRALQRLRAGRASVVALVLVVAVALGWGTFRRNRDFASEIALWDISIANCPLNDRAYHSRASFYVLRGQLEKALPDYDKAIALNPGFVKAWSGRGMAYASLGRYEEAITDLTRAINLKPGFAEAYSSRGSALGNLGRVDAAIQDFDRAISLDPALTEAYFNRGTALEAKLEVDAAIKDFDKAIALSPDHALAYNSRGMIYDGKGEYDRAIKDYDQAIRIRPGYAEAYNNRGSAALAKGQVDAALQDFDRAIALEPDGAQHYSNRGNVSMARGQLDLAIRDYDKAIALKPDLAAAYQNRAMACLQIKAYDRAWADVGRLRELGVTPDPSFIQTLIKLSGRTE